MLNNLKKSLWLLLFALVICCGLYPLVLWGVGKGFFPFQANGSIVRDAGGVPVGSLLIAQGFTKDQYFQPRPSACSYDASASASAALAPSNYALRNRVAVQLGPIVRYKSGPQAGQLVAPDIEKWFAADSFQGAASIVAQWAGAHGALASAWVSGDSTHAAYVGAWSASHPADVAQFIKDNPATPHPAPADLAVVFFTSFSKTDPGKFPSSVTRTGADGKSVTDIEPVASGSDIQSTFFDMWRTDHPQADLQDVPADLVTSSASGLDPNISLANALFQLDRVAGAWAVLTKRDQGTVHAEIEQIVRDNATAPWFGLVGEKMINVLKVNIELQKRYAAPNPS
jgi:K+-transporting ATPase ATPase C chain